MCSSLHPHPLSERTYKRSHHLNHELKAIRVNADGTVATPPMDHGWLPLGDESLLYNAPAVHDDVVNGACHLDDLWSLGCIVYQMFCGSPPFLSDDVGDLRYDVVLLYSFLSVGWKTFVLLALGCT